MKIAIFTDTYYPDINGVARTLKHFTSYLEKQNISYKVFAPNSDSTEYISSNIRRFKSWSFFLYPECRLALPNMFQLKAELEAFSPDIIHVATPFNMGLCGIYLAKKLAIPLVASYHTDFDHYLQFYELQLLSHILWKYMKWFHKPCKKIFVPSHETLTQLTLHGFANLEIWPHGVDCELFHPYYGNEAIRKQHGVSRKYVLTFVGRLAPEKDIKTLMAVANALPAEINEQVQWLIVGDGPLKAEMEAQSPANMTFTGYLTGEALAEIYSASDLFVFPSPTETFGNVVIEALASGTPAITANSGGVKNIIKHGVTGFLCETGNAVEFTDAIIKLISNDCLRKKFGSEGRNYALTQNWDTIFDHLLWQYQSVLEGTNFQKFA
ncbi:glycosyltransferase family 4 protein [Neobacillus kokaensis]|uniref:Glycosyl transferase n=1 Tax=Neobacillus kokaensis TaxID=2759023 RepID=A0ABQ3NB38_9BACI|nr:glycosyltransferase family 1 protein [Neobacillus kokaensis]GHI01135.1 glycosyl transferase [Neobacillus kokaensis]